MPAGLPHRPPVAMKLWLSRRFGRASQTDSSAPGHASDKAISIAAIEHLVQNRVRIFLRHTWLVTILGTVILAGGIGLAVYIMTKDTVMKIAAGPEGGINARFVEVMTQTFAKDHAKIELQLIRTSGAAESARAIIDHKADLAILPSTLGKSPDWPVVAILRQNVMALIVPAPSTPGAASAAASAASTAPKKTAKAAKSSKGAKADKIADKVDQSDKADESDKTDKAEASDKIEKVAQLTGHRIGIVTGNEASPDLLNVVLRHYGVPLDKVQVSEIDPTTLADAISNNQVDAIFVAGPATGHAITDAVGSAARNGVAPTFIAIDQADGIAKRDLAFDSTDIDAGTFGGNPPTPNDSLKTLSFPEYLVARKSFDHSAITKLARLIYSSRLALAAEMPGEVKIQAPSTDKDAGVLVHPGARAYLSDDVKSFFDRYGDDIFYALLIFPLFGSAIAAAAGYFRNNHRTRRLRLLQRLLDLVRKAHAAPSLAALDQFQLDLDNVVIEVIHQSEREEYDQTVQMSFSLALDQVRFAIAARRAALLDQAGTDAKPGTKAAAA
jgi:TRAP-type uncharacterized transport system substrate-binding protein